MKSLTPKNARWYSVFGLPVLMCVEYISALKVATSYKFLFIAFLSIKYSVVVRFLSVTLLLFSFLIKLLFFICLLRIFLSSLIRKLTPDCPLRGKITLDCD